MPESEDTHNAAPPEPSLPPPGIDLEELAQIIFERLLFELQIENERAGR